MEVNDPRHGTTNGYGNMKCRCSACRAAWAASIYKRKSVRPPLLEGDPRHGTTNGYDNWSCRCSACRLAHTTYETARRKRKVA